MSESSIDKSINLGAMGEALNDKMDRDGLNANINPAAGYGVDYVVNWKVPTESDPTWYRLYRSGWVEQGGYVSANNVREISSSITLPKEMLNSNYSVLLSPQSIYRNDTAAWNICIGYRIISPSVLIVNSF